MRSSSSLSSPPSSRPHRTLSTSRWSPGRCSSSTSSASSSRRSCRSQGSRSRCPHDAAETDGHEGGLVSREPWAEALYARIRGCTSCALAQTRALAVPGEGPLDAEVMLIGEAPGANEDKQGRPFVGQAGQFLDELLAAAGLARAEVYVCNVLKCRPPANRDPLPGEIDACRDYLDEQIDMVDPLVIVTLGRFSMAKFFPAQTISRVHGRAREIAGCFYVPMYHPAAALHQQSLRAIILEDFRELGALLERARRTRGAGTPARVVGPTEAARLVPALSAVKGASPPPANSAGQPAIQGRLFNE
ncbi:MAG: uracil-DNA glycosylase [Dehalococcoidia bacterium]|nr:uracil-DNA glycosylase [Dehalococcoidia bacterium]